MIKKALVLGACLAVAALGGAEDFGGTTVVIPVAMHGPGKLGTQWVTDVWIANYSSVAKTVTVTFYPTGGGSQSSTVSVGTYSTAVLRDVVLATFGLDDAKGMLILSVEDTSQFNAQARIYNTGNPVGEFGQFVPGFALHELSRQGYLYGLSGVSGNRTNVGIANPTELTFDVVVQLKSGTSTTLGSATVTLGPKALIQINDIFAYLNVSPEDNAQVNMSSGDNLHLLYGYASVVRGDTGDAIFVPGLAVNSGPH